MARTSRNEVSRARRGVSVRGERRIVSRSPVNGPVAASIAWIQHNDTHLGAPSDIMGSSLVPSSGVEVQPAVQPGCLADGLDMQQLICMGLQPSRTDLDVLTLGEVDTTERLENIDIGAANLQTVFSLEFGNQSYESIRASRFQSDGSLASVLSCGAGNPTSNALYAAPTAPTASDYNFSAALCLGPEVISSLPEILPLEEAEELHMLDQLFPPELDQNLENASSLSPPKQLYQPNLMEGPMQIVNYDHSHTSRSLLPLGEMIHHSATHPQSFSFGHWHQQGPQQPLTDLDGDMQKQLLGSAPFHSSPSNEPCAKEYPVQYPPSPNSNVITAIVPNFVEAAPTENLTPFYSRAQSPATNALPNSALIPNGSAHSASANHSNVPARIMKAGRSGRVPRDRLPRSHQATVGRLRQIRPAPTPDASLATMNLAEVMLGRIETQRQNHMNRERKKRQHMNELYATIRSFLPPAAGKIRHDNATVLLEMQKSINRSENELKILKQQLEHSQQLVAALCHVNPSIHHMDTTAARLFTTFTTRGYTCVDHTRDPSPLPAVESCSGWASVLGTNVAINYCHDNYSLTVSSPYLGQAVALLEPMLIAIQDHHLEVLFASIITTSNSHIYSLQCKASSDAELLRNNLQSVLQGIVNNFPSSSSYREHHA